MKQWVEIVDHNDDPGRYTVVFSTGGLVILNADYSRIFQRRCRKPLEALGLVSREPGAHILKHGPRDELLKKLGWLQKEEEPVSIVRPSAANRYLPDEVKTQLIAYARKKWPYGDNYHARISQNGNYVVGYTNDYPLQHGIGEEQTLTPIEYKDLDTILDKPQ